MWETAAFAVGLVLVAAGVFSFVYPLRWIGIRTRAMALVVIAAGFLVVAPGTQMQDSYAVYLGFAAAFIGFISLFWPLRFLHIQTRRVASLVLVLGLFLSIGAALLPCRETRAETITTKLDE